MLARYPIVFIPILSMLTVQLIKILLEIARGKFAWTWRAVTAYGGMPSGHTALTASLATIIGRLAGFDSPAFGLACVFALLVIWDALGFRRQLGWHAKGFNKLILLLEDYDRNMFPKFEERLGHTPLEVLVGGILGVLLALGFQAIIL